MVAEIIGRSREDVGVGAGEAGVGALERMQMLIKVRLKHQEW